MVTAAPTLQFSFSKSWSGCSPSCSTPAAVRRNMRHCIQHYVHGRRCAFLTAFAAIAALAASCAPFTADAPSSPGRRQPCAKCRSLVKLILPDLPSVKVRHQRCPMAAWWLQFSNRHRLSKLREHFHH